MATAVYFHLSISLCQSLWVSLCLLPSLSVTLPITESVPTLSVYQSLSLSVCQWLSLYLLVSVYKSLSVCLVYQSLCLSVCLSICQSLSLCLLVSLSSLSIIVSVFLSVTVCQIVSLHVHLSVTLSQSIKLIGTKIKFDLLPPNKPMIAWIVKCYLWIVWSTVIKFCKIEQRHKYYINVITYHRPRIKQM